VPRQTPALAILALVLLAACGGTDTAGLYAPYRARALWVYGTHFTGNGTSYTGRLEVESFPQGDTTRLEVRILPNPADRSAGGRQTYTLDFRTTPPALVALATNGGRAVLEPPLPLPGGAADGAGAATYEPGAGSLKGRRLGFHYTYTAQPGGRVEVPAGAFEASITDLAYRGDLPFTGANVRLEFAAGVGLVQAEWKTSYRTTTLFSLERLEKRP
jgi:hypothetical protein